MAWTSGTVRLIPVGPGRASSAAPACAIDAATRAADRSDYMARALELWPRLDREKVRKARDNPRRLARLIERRTGESFEVILSMLDGG